MRLWVLHAHVCHCSYSGDAIMHLKALGFDDDEIRHRVVAYCPQVRRATGAAGSFQESRWLL